MRLNTYRAFVGPFIACVLAFGLLMQNIASANNFSPEEETVLTVAGYVGLAEFCWAYGVDYRDTAREISRSMMAEVDGSSPAQGRLLRAGLEAGARGEIYSAAVGEFIAVYESTDMELACNRIYAQFQRVTSLK